MTDTLLLLHGFPVDGSMWDLQVQALSGTIQVLAPSLPGFGTQPGAGNVMTMEGAARRCLEALDTAEAGRVVVCGLSMGGYAAFELWRRAPERFAGLVLSNRISVPTLVISSTADELIPPAATTPLAEQIPNAQLEMIEGVGHLSNLEAPGEFTLLLERHLTLCGML